MGKLIVLHLGDDIRWNHELYAKFKDQFEIRRSYSMSRPEFIRALKDKKFGDFSAMYRPFWNTGGEMGNWDEELISLLPDSCMVYASAGAGFDWVDTACLAKKGTLPFNGLDIVLTKVDANQACRSCVLQCRRRLHRVCCGCSSLADYLHLPPILLVSNGCSLLGS